ncbi:MAG: carboxypeptidase regulatory-like domain-containing protein [Myxococcales bacterium]|nr:carboxypeptidase regulatory-like domain-containing protein [Myxococcales bacterium]
MRTTPLKVAIGAILACAIALVGACGQQQPAPDPVPIDGDDIGGAVTSADGPEAGVWVIVETTDLGTRFIRSVVTDDLGRYLVPDLPTANYDVWVRGYGLVDSPKVQAAPGEALNLTAVVAPNAQAAAQVYPAGYWASLIEVPAKSEFPGGGPQGNGISPNMHSQAQWLQWLKTGSCFTCHQIGNRATREIPAALGEFPGSVAAWARRIQSGQASVDMARESAMFGQSALLEMFASWTDRIADGELPPAPPRPQGLERNVVVTLWDWADEQTYLHDQISSDRRNPQVNANGLIYGSPELSTDLMPVLDPVRHTVSQVQLTPRDPETQPGATQAMLQPSPYWGEELIWDSKTNAHNPMFDGKGRVWMTATVRPPPNPDFCKAGSSHPSAQATPLETSGRQVAMYDPATGELTHVDTCFDTHHLNFAADANDTLWLNGYGSTVVGWIDTRMFDETQDEVASQGWTALILDTNGNGMRDEYVGPDYPVDPTKDKQIADAFYAVAPAVDGSVWGSILGFPGAVVRLDPGSNPPATALAERYELPWDEPNAPVNGYSPRGMDIDRNGVAWMGLGSGHMASFDRSKCNGPLNGPNALGRHCPEGWTLYPEPLPQFKNVTDSGSAEGSYYTWVDQFDTLGLGPNTPINTGNLSEGLLALDDGEWVVLRVPYPMGFYVKGMDGRIDDPSLGWKGKGVWTAIGTRAPFHMETGQGTLPKVVHFQVRPDPLAK